MSPICGIFLKVREKKKEKTSCTVNQCINLSKIYFENLPLVVVIDPFSLRRIASEIFTMDINYEI